MPTDARARWMFFGLVAALAATLAVICAWEPVLGDGWAHYIDARAPLTFERLIEYGRLGYHGNNPRWGQLALVLTYDVRFVAIVVSPLMIVLALLASMTLIRGRWPRPGDPADSWLFVQVIATAVATMPQFGAIWFYRPNCTNYLYPLAVQLAWLVPYRLCSAQPRSPLRWLAPLAAVGMFGLGVVAGAGNEHTGFGLAVGALLCTYAGWRRSRRVPVWAIAGVLGLGLGQVALLTAPGQMARYGGMAARSSLLDGVIARGVIGNLNVLKVLLAWASPMLIVVLLAARRALWDRATWTPRIVREVGVCLAVAGVMFATALAAPRQASRLMVAPSTMIALALGILMVELGHNTRVARRLRIACVTIVASALAASLVVQRITSVEGRERLALLEVAPRGAIVQVPAFTFSMPTPVSWGDDLRSASVTRRVAQLFGLARIEVAR